MNPNKSRGEYRPIYEVLFHAPEFQVLSANAKLVFLTVKCLSGPTGCKSWPAFASVVSEMCKLSPRATRNAIKELVDGAWIEVDGSVVWVVNGLKFEPSFSTGVKHKDYVAKQLAALPKCDLLDRFRAKYAAYLPDTPSDSPSDGVSDGVSDGPCDTSTTATTTTTTTATTTATASSHARPAGVLPPSISRSARFVAMANRGITERFGEQPRPIRHTHSSVDETIAAWDAAGVPEEFAARQLFERARGLANDRPPTTLSYFRAAILEAWEAEQAHRAAATVAVPECGAVVVGAIGSDAMHVRMAVKYAREGHLEWQDECARLGVKWQEVA